jgi:starch phosphorylase
VEIRDAVGPENFFLFGLTAEQVEERKRAGRNPRANVEGDPVLKRVLETIAADTFNRGTPGLFEPLVRSLTDEDPFLVTEDFQAYLAAQDRVSTHWRDPKAWARASIQTVARMGSFSSDRSIREYAERVWNVKPVPID